MCVYFFCRFPGNEPETITTRIMTNKTCIFPFRASPSLNAVFNSDCVCLFVFGKTKGHSQVISDSDRYDERCIAATSYLSISMYTRR